MFAVPSKESDWVRQVIKTMLDGSKGVLPYSLMQKRIKPNLVILVICLVALGL